MSEYPDCYESSNVICKHIRASKTYYLDLNDRLPLGVTVVSATLDTDATGLIVDATGTVVEVDTVAEENSNCSGKTLYAGRTITFQISSGSVSDEEVIVTARWLQDDGDIDAFGLRLIVGGSV